jgi:hypothetical protein
MDKKITSKIKSPKCTQEQKQKVNRPRIPWEVRLPPKWDESSSHQRLLRTNSLTGFLNGSGTKWYVVEGTEGNQAMSGTLEASRGPQQTKRAYKATNHSCHSRKTQSVSR